MTHSPSPADDAMVAEIKRQCETVQYRTGLPELSERQLALIARIEADRAMLRKAEVVVSTDLNWRDQYSKRRLNQFLTELRTHLGDSDNG